MSVESTLCDNIAAELRATVPSLTPARQHLYTPYSIENLVADGQPHFAVWMAPEEQGGGVVLEPFTTLSSMSRYPVLVSYWEPSNEADLLTPDEEATKRLTKMMEDCRARFLDENFRATPPAWKMDWLQGASGVGGTQVGGVVRWWVAEIACWVVLDHAS